jgi:hypothetical protein
MTFVRRCSADLPPRPKIQRHCVPCLLVRRPYSGAFDALGIRRSGAAMVVRYGESVRLKNVKARTVHGRYGAEMRKLRRLMRLLDEEQRRVLELVK